MTKGVTELEIVGPSKSQCQVYSQTMSNDRKDQACERRTDQCADNPTRSKPRKQMPPRMTLRQHPNQLPFPTAQRRQPVAEQVIHVPDGESQKERRRAFDEVVDGLAALEPLGGGFCG